VLEVDLVKLCLVRRSPIARCDLSILRGAVHLHDWTLSDLPLFYQTRSVHEVTIVLHLPILASLECECSGAQ